MSNGMIKSLALGLAVALTSGFAIQQTSPGRQVTQTQPSALPATRRWDANRKDLLGEKEVSGERLFTECRRLGRWRTSRSRESRSIAIRSLSTPGPL
jgi:hypothetical protein